MKRGRNHHRSQREEEPLLHTLLPFPSSSFFAFSFSFCICFLSFILGLRLSTQFLFLLVSFNHHPNTPFLDPSSSSSSSSSTHFLSPSHNSSFSGKSNRVHVGRHEILIRKWPHPDPLQTLKAHQLIEIVQKEQKRSHVERMKKRLIVITPTYVRTFQALHLSSLMHTLRLVPAPLIWIVVEAGNKSDETAALLSISGLPFFHFSYGRTMTSSWIEREQTEKQLRIEGLRFVREQYLDGIVVFADDSNTHSLDFFNVAQSVKGIGSLSVGLLHHPDGEIDQLGTKQVQLPKRKVQTGTKQSFLIQGPVCNMTGNIIGWYAPNIKAQIVDGMDQHLLLLRSLKWAGFVLDARLLWDEVRRPRWICAWEEWVGNSDITAVSPLQMVKDMMFIEALGNCGRDVLVWWLRIEARADSKFPSRWLIDPPLEVVVPAKHTPWPDPPLVYASPPPPLFSTAVHQTTRHRPSRVKRGSRHSEKRHNSDATIQKVARLQADAAFR